MKILTKEQNTAINLLAKSDLAQKFYWTGGTLLAYYYLEHRRSFDLDFFSESNFSFEEINTWVWEMRKKAGFKKVSSRKIFNRWEFLFENGKVLRVEFVYFNKEKKTLKKRKRLLGVLIDSLEDIAANKTLAYFDRNEPKDLFDLYFLIKKKKLTIKKLLALVKQKFGIEFNESLFWSEAFKSLSLLSKLKPLMLETDNQKKERILQGIESYFKTGADQFLQKNLS